MSYISHYLTPSFWQNGGAHPLSLHRMVKWLSHFFALPCGHAYHKTETRTHKPKTPSHFRLLSFHPPTTPSSFKPSKQFPEDGSKNALLSKPTHSMRSKTSPWTWPSCRESARLLRWIRFQREQKDSKPWLWVWSIRMCLWVCVSGFETLAWLNIGWTWWSGSEEERKKKPGRRWEKKTVGGGVGLKKNKEKERRRRRRRKKRPLVVEWVWRR